MCITHGSFISLLNLQFGMGTFAVRFLCGTPNKAACMLPSVLPNRGSRKEQEMYARTHAQTCARVCVFVYESAHTSKGTCSNAWGATRTAIGEGQPQSRQRI
jgi:hypothetical protein